jgi:hypothetical protein
MSNPQRSRITATLVKAEKTAYGEDSPARPALTPSWSPVLLRSLPPTPTNLTARSTATLPYSPAGSIVGAKSAKLKVKVEMRGGGLDGNVPKPKAPDYDPCCSACGMQKGRSASD